MSWFSTITGDPNFWVFLSTVICVGFIARKAAGPLVQNLDNRSAQIEQRLLEAEKLHSEARGILEEYKTKSANALSEAEQVLRNAERRAEQLRVHMEQDLKDTMARQEINARSRIQRLEEEAIRSVKTVLTEAALAQVRQQAAANVAAPSIEQSLADIKTTLQNQRVN